MDEIQTCGKGLAGHIPLPRQIAALALAMSRLFDVHTKALEVSEPAGRTERDAYESLSRQYRDVADRLLALAGEAEGYRTLEMATHDMGFMTGPEPLEAFEGVVAARRALFDLLEAGRAQDDAMLAAMRGSGGRT